MPLSVIRYRNFDAFLGETTLETIPSCTSVFNFSVSTAEEIFSADARNSKNEFLMLNIKSRKINSTYLQRFRNRTGNSKSVHQCKLVGKAKEKHSTTDSTVSAIGYELGFEHSQSINKFFKQKTRQSPLKFRKSFVDLKRAYFNVC